LPNPETLEVNATHRTIANYGVLFKTTAKGKDVEALETASIKQKIRAKIQKNKVGFLVGGNGCLAYQNDSVWGGLKALSGDKFFLRSSRKGDVTKYGVLINLSNSGQKPALEKILPDLNYSVDLYVRLPLLLLDPDSRNKVFGKRRSPAESGRIRKLSSSTFALPGSRNHLSLSGIFLDIFFPGYIFVHPGLAWFTNALVREAVYLVIGNHRWGVGSRPVNYHNHELLTQLKTLVSREVLTRIINEGDYTAALKLWCTSVGPLLASSCVYNYTSSNVWYLGSLEKFNRIVSEGGWISLGTDITTNWKLNNAFRGHAVTARAWESFLKKEYKKTGLSFEQLAEISVPKIQKTFKSLLRKSPWMTVTTSAK
jgi:hypothetical protein